MVNGHRNLLKELKIYEHLLKFKLKLLYSGILFGHFDYCFEMNF